MIKTSSLYIGADLTKQAESIVKLEWDSLTGKTRLNVLDQVTDNQVEIDLEPEEVEALCKVLQSFL